MAEAAVVRAVQKHLTERGCWHINIHGSGVGRNGLPDILAIYRGRALCIECKSQTGRLRALQRWELRLAAAAGAVCVVARGAADVRQALDEIDKEVGTS